MQKRPEFGARRGRIIQGRNEGVEPGGVQLEKALLQNDLYRLASRRLDHELGTSLTQNCGCVVNQLSSLGFNAQVDRALRFGGRVRQQDATGFRTLDASGCKPVHELKMGGRIHDVNTR